MASPLDHEQIMLDLVHSFFSGAILLKVEGRLESYVGQHTSSPPLIMTSYFKIHLE